LSLQAALFGCCTQPRDGSQNVSTHENGLGVHALLSGVCTQPVGVGPLESQVSIVQSTLSLQAPLFGVCVQPKLGSQPSMVQLRLSSQLRCGNAHRPLLQMLSVQKLLSLQSVLNEHIAVGASMDASGMCASGCASGIVPPVPPVPAWPPVPLVPPLPLEPPEPLMPPDPLVPPLPNLLGSKSVMAEQPHRRTNKPS
jgi:hypothetical protein